MFNADLMFSSKTDLHATPRDFYAEIDAEFSFDVDVCALPDNTKCRRFFSPEMDGLKQEWVGTCWMNPPYGRTINNWVRKAYESSLSGATVVGLLPARTDTAWFHDYCYGKAELRFIRGRLKFGDAKNSAPFPSVLVIWRAASQQTKEAA
ncbi:phage N-6-adenine-methyltransferase [Paenibacillus sp. RC73]|uniref:DNA N-6-adenine-methyltransferase n=1 Tax=Paenibacillus sp. RC73 TaxID=3156250 RepID=UPI0038366900